MRVLDLFSGTGSATQAFVDRGHEVVTLDIDPAFGADWIWDVRFLPIDLGRSWHGGFDFIWASPPCTCFSVASIGAHWTGGKQAYIPKTEAARNSIDLVRHTVALISSLRPSAWLIENPRGVLRKMRFMEALPRRVTVTYCQYNDSRMKPTDLWTNLTAEEWTPRPMCKNGSPCHVAAPRGSSTGTQGLKTAKERGMVPYELSMELCLAMENLPTKE